MIPEKRPENIIGNYHTHTSRCHHAYGEDREFVEAAIQAGYASLGFSDHTPWPYRTGHVSGVRMLPEELDGYMASVKSLREHYRDSIRIHLGLEVEYLPEYLDWMHEMRDRGIEYFIMGQHTLGSEENEIYTARACVEDDAVLRYADICCEGIRSGLFSYICHPDLFMDRRRDEDFSPACMEAADRIVQACQEMHIPLEYNLLGVLSHVEDNPRGYPSRAFWDYVSRYDVPVIIGVDAHEPYHLTHPQTRKIAEDRIRELGMKLITRLPMDDDM
ncbi:MAG: histidinol-phosphatase [Clostridia bacterium]|nr:histidinol-phosphatase [Clostridia bacterium]MBR2286799.1 histidinol-phosphatase [Clostridia bacterium]